MERSKQNGSPQPNASSRLISVREAAERLGVSRGKAYKMVARGSLKVVDVDGTMRVCSQHLEACIANGSFPPAGSTPRGSIVTITSNTKSRRVKKGKGRKE